MLSQYDTMGKQGECASGPKHRNSPTKARGSRQRSAASCKPYGGGDLRAPCEIITDFLLLWLGV